MCHFIPSASLNTSVVMGDRVEGGVVESGTKIAI